MTTPADYLQGRVFGPGARDDLAVLGALAGQSLCGIRFFATLDMTREYYFDSTPIYFFPIGEHDSVMLGMHLRPDDVGQDRTALATLDEFGLLEVGNSVRATVIEQLARYEVDGSRQQFEAAVALVNRLVAPDFYIPGRLGKIDDDTVRDVVAQAVGGSVRYYNGAIIGQPDDVKRRILLEPNAQSPRALVLQARLAGACNRLGKTDDAAAAAAVALDCYHHTAFSESIDEFYALAERLAQQRPEAFTDRHRIQLVTRTDRARLQLAGDHYEHDTAWGAKILCDLCHDLGHYTTPPMGTLLRRYFEKLGWAWALELCALRGVVATAQSG